MSSHTAKRRKRKDFEAPDAVSDAQRNHLESLRLKELLREHFEAAFAPLPDATEAPSADAGSDVSTESQDGEESEWEGIANDEDTFVEEIHYNYGVTDTHALPPPKYKAFMSSRPPSDADNKQQKTAGRAKNSDSDDEADAANLKNDVALQRLLRESHLLGKDDAISHSSTTRQKALDLRFQGLGSKTSVFAQPKMPLAQRKGLLEKAAAREQTRRREAEANGIILEKSVKNEKRPSNKRQRAIGAPTVGRFRKGMLMLSKRDVSRIQKPQRSRR